MDITALVAFHRQHQTLATVTATQPPGRFGNLNFEGNKITRFDEKPPGDSSWINGGFFVLSPQVLEYIQDDASTWEKEPLERLAQAGQLTAYKHSGFWKPMDTLRDKMRLEELWETGKAPWKVW